MAPSATGLGTATAVVAEGGAAAAAVDCGASAPEGARGRPSAPAGVDRHTLGRN